MNERNLTDNEKIIIAHRGASGYLPEHTLEAKTLAHAMDADYLEQDVVMTKDDHLIVLHDHFLDRTTNVAEIFPQRHRKDGRFYAIDFALEEIKSLKFTEGFKVTDGKKIQIYPTRFPINKSDFHIHTLEEEIEFIKGLNFSTRKNAGLYTEIKAPWFHQSEGKDITVKTLEVLKKYDYTKNDDKIFLQIFDFNELKRIKTDLMPKMNMNLKIIQLIAYNSWNETYVMKKDGSKESYDYNWMLTKSGLKELSKYADGIGPDYHMLIDTFSTKDNIKLTNLAEYGHENNMLVHPYTLRADDLPNYVTDMENLLNILFIKCQVDGLFTDFPDKGVKFLHKKGFKQA